MIIFDYMYLKGVFFMGKSISGNLIETRDCLLKEINLLSFEELNHKPESTTWSIAQVCHHLFLAEISFTKAISYGLKKVDGKKAAPKPIHLVADLTKKYQAPDMVVPSDSQFELQQLIEMLAESRKTFLEVYNRIEDKSILAAKSVKHPLFGDLSLDQWVELLEVHEDRHIEQIKKIKSLLN
jgi:hypothetical protein